MKIVMNTDEIVVLARRIALETMDKDPIILKTHISWVILSGNYAYKIKKPVRFSFLDFSSIEKRKYYCHRELQLNRRLAPEMYLSVVPIYKIDKLFLLKGKGREIVDYAVLMKRMNPEMLMSTLLRKNKVDERLVKCLAEKVEEFHHHATIIRKKPDLKVIKERFNDLLLFDSASDNHPDIHFKDSVLRSIEITSRFLDQSAALLFSRSKYGFYRDLHGDLHTGNIFLCPEPVVFDCLEFNEQMRYIDILDEVAFLCMDIEALGHQYLSTVFYKTYLSISKILPDNATDALFVYYKCYRANIRAKVCLVSPLNKAFPSASSYLMLMSAYTIQLEKLILALLIVCCQMRTF